MNEKGFVIICKEVRIFVSYRYRWIVWGLFKRVWNKDVVKVWK